MIGELFGGELNYSLTVYPDENEAKPKSNPLGLINEAISRKDEGFDEFWAVYDKDGYTKHEDSFKLAKDNACFTASIIVLPTGANPNFESICPV